MLLNTNKFIPQFSSIVEFDQLSSSAELVFDSGNLAFTYDHRKQGIVGAKAPYPVKTGKYYFEAVATTIVKDGSNNYATLGLLRADYNFDMQALGGAGLTVFVGNNSSGNCYANGTLVANLGTASSGDRYGFAVDFTAGLFWCRRNNGNWNNSGTANPATGVGGASLGDLADRYLVPASTLFFKTEKHTYKFTTASFTDTAPSGFGNWPGTASGSNDNGIAVLSSPKNANMIMSNGNLTATRGASAPAAARSKDYKGAGRFYLEFTPTSWAGNGDCVGFANPAAITSNITGAGSNGAYCYRNGGVIWVNGANSGISLGTISNGQRVDVAVNLSVGLIWFRKNNGNWNNSPTADPSKDLEGLSINVPVFSPCIGLGGTSSAAGHNVTANLGATSPSGTPPAGYSTIWQSLNQILHVKSLWVGAL